MKSRKCFMYVFDGYADWEPSLAIANLNKYTDFSIYSFSVDGKPIKSMGGITVLPNRHLHSIEASEMDLLLLPGGEAWECGGNAELGALVQHALTSDITVAAICGATVFLANQGILNKLMHTSNGLEYLKKKSPGYSGETFYRNQPCITHKNLITANGAAMIEFAIAIFEKFQLAEKEVISKISDLYKSGGMNNRFYS